MSVPPSQLAIESDKRLSKCPSRKLPPSPPPPFQPPQWERGEGVIGARLRHRRARPSGRGSRAKPLGRDSFRAGFTLIEMGVAMVLLAAAMILVLQLGYWSMRHRSRMAARFAALEFVSNVLEQARAVSWEGLTDEWAESQRIPEDLADQFPEGQLTVRVEPVEARPLTKQIRVELRWTAGDGESQGVRMLGLFSPRTFSQQDRQP